MEITVESIKSRLKMLPDIETAAIACEFKKDGLTIRQDEDIFIVFSISNFFPLSTKEQEERDIRYEEIIKNWKQAIFGKDSKVKLFSIDTDINEDLGKFKKINLFYEPNMIITKEDLGQRFIDIGGIKEAWIICEVGDGGSYINYRYDMGIYIKLVNDADEDEKNREIKKMLYLLFDGYETLHRLDFLDEEVKEIDYKWLNLKLKDMTKIL